MRKVVFLIGLLCSCRNPASVSGESVPPYDRSEWGGWVDVDGDCQDTRQEVLIAESIVPVTFADGRKCRVATGKWKCPYTGTTFTDPSDLDIDHVVALKEVHYAGGWRWDAARKRAYFNDLENSDTLMAVSSSANRSKGSRNPSEWMPSDPTSHCAYVKARISVLKSHGLLTGCDDALNLVLQHCK